MQCRGRSESLSSLSWKAASARSPSCAAMSFLPLRLYSSRTAIQYRTAVLSVRKSSEISAGESSESSARLMTSSSWESSGISMMRSCSCSWVVGCMSFSLSPCPSAAWSGSLAMLAGWRALYRGLDGLHKRCTAVQSCVCYPCVGSEERRAGVHEERRE